MYIPGVAVADITNTHGNKGDLLIHLLSPALGSVFVAGLELYIVPPLLKVARQQELRSCIKLTPERFCVHISEINDLDGARELVGRRLLAARSDLEAAGFARGDASLLGRSVEDEELGYIGRITELIHGPAQDIWCVSSERFGEVLIPAVEEITGVIPAAGTIRISAPKGLIE